MSSASNGDKLMAGLGDRIKNMRTKEAEERSMTPVKVPAKTKHAVLKSFRVTKGRAILKRPIIGSAWSYSQTTGDKLERITLREMHVPKVHKGHFLLGRVISDLDIKESLEFILEDPEGNAVKVCLYNYPRYLASERDVKSIFQKGSLWIIREPTYRRPGWDEPADPIVSVDSPSDILPVASTDEIMRGVRWSTGASPHIPSPLVSIEEYRVKGANEFKAKNWLNAAVCYTDGLRLDKNSLIMRLNRSEAYIRLGWYSSAFYDASQAIKAGIEDDQLLRKAVNRAAKASYYSKNYQCAISYAQKLPNDADCTAWIERAKRRIHEQETGNYDWCAVYQETLAECPRPDVADYHGPIEVKEVNPLRGRGLYATRDIKIGELLLASKPIASWFLEDDLPGKRDCYMVYNMLLEGALDRSIPTILAFVAQKMWDDEQLSALVKSMYAGPEASTPLPYSPPKATKGKPLSHPLKSNVDIDIARLEGVVSFDTFMLDNAVKPVFRGAKPELMLCGYALYGLASFCNYSCLPSAYRTFFGDFLTIRASRDLKKGEEITIQYMPDDRDLMLRRFKSWKMRFLCDCMLCKADAADGEKLCKLRKETVKELDFKNLKSLQYASDKISQIEETYLDTPARRACGVKPELWEAYEYRAEVAKCFIKEDRSTDRFYLMAVECLMSCLEAQGIKILDKSTHGPLESQYRGRLPVDVSIGPVNLVHGCALLSLEISTIFDWKKDAVRAENWLKVAAWVDNIFAGGGNMLFKLRYAQLLKEMELTELAEKVL